MSVLLFPTPPQAGRGPHSFEIMKKQTISIIVGIIIAIMIITFFFFVPWLQSQEDEAEYETIKEVQQ